VWLHSPSHAPGIARTSIACDLRLLRCLCCDMYCFGWEGFSALYGAGTLLPAPLSESTRRCASLLVYFSICTHAITCCCLIDLVCLVTVCPCAFVMASVPVPWVAKNAHTVCPYSLASLLHATLSVVVSCIILLDGSHFACLLSRICPVAQRMSELRVEIATRRIARVTIQYKITYGPDRSSLT